MMILRNKILMVAGVGMLVSSLANAVDVAVYVKAGFPQIGAGVGIGVTDTLQVRAGLDYLKFSSGDVEDTDITYKADLKFKGAEALLDWYPFNGSFHLTGGAYLNKNELTIDAKPTNGEFTINDVAYQADEVGSLNGKIDFASLAPYVGIGWGHVAGKDGHFHFATDIGVLLQGSPNTTLNVTCGPLTDSGSCTQLQSDVTVEENKLNDDISGFKYLPVATFSVAYRF